jgi:hypothetical protein
MKRLLLIIAMTAGIVTAYAQSPAPESDTVKNPVKQIDPEVKQLPQDMHYAKESVRINADELPAAVLKKLKALEPTGWEKSVVYHYKNAKFYMVEIREEGNSKTYRFDYDGKLIKDDNDVDKD